MNKKRLEEIEVLYDMIDKFEENMRFQKANELLIRLKEQHLLWMIETIKAQQKKLELSTSRDKHALIKANIKLSDEVSELKNKLDRFTKSITEVIEENHLVSEYDDADLPIRPEVSN